jgi:nucleotide-binding universal stress UspA family protein
LLRVVPDVSSREIQSLNDFERGLGLRFAEEMRESAADYLTLVADRFEEAGRVIQTAVRYGPAADAILDFAERHAVDLVTMSTHGRTGLRRWVYGSVTQKVLDQWPGSMLVSRAGCEELA